MSGTRFSLHESFDSVAGPDQFGPQLVYAGGGGMDVRQVWLVLSPKSFHKGSLDLFDWDVRAGLTDLLAPVDHPGYVG